ncbi:MAG: glycosyltransferase [Bacteroides sp.]|nr:glycosyltransferase [Bacteroides sp.]
MRYSILIPVYNRPEEVDELLAGLTKQTFTDFEVVIVEDGSAIPCREVVERYADRLAVSYRTKPNSGPGQTRNVAAEQARGEYFLVLDSDVIPPPHYLEAIESELRAAPCDAFGGPDRAHPDFSDVQKAINYAMTSFFTTGGIRGGRRKLDVFHPRSFNMGIRSEVYRALGGFSPMRFGEDIDFSLRIIEAGYTTRLFPKAWVYHKRRTDLRKFFKQVHNSGIARIHLMKRHPGSLKLVHLLPAAFTLGLGFFLLGGLVCAWSLTLPGAFALLIGVDALRQTRSPRVAVLSVAASTVQLVGYGTGFLRAWWQRCVCRKGEFEAFSQTFYK